MSFELQNQIRKNAMEMRAVTTDLYEWEQEMELKEKTKAKFKKEERQQNQEIFKAAKEQQIRESKVKEVRKVEVKQKQQQGQQGEVKADLVRDTNTIKEYYGAWDKFNVDQELTKLEQEQQRAYRAYNPYEDSKNYKRAKPKVKINVKGRRNIVSDPSELKDKGNLHFQSLEYEKAINCYSECLKRLNDENITLEDMTADRKKLQCVVHSNRSMAYLKNQQTSKALEDATQSLKYNPKYAKSYYRRAECHKKLRKYKDSLKDFKMVKALEPSQTKADNQIRKIEAFLSKRARETKESMVIRYEASMMMGSRRIEIGEMDDFEETAPEESNYLDEL